MEKTEFLRKLSKMEDLNTQVTILVERILYEKARNEDVSLLQESLDRFTTDKIAKAILDSIGNRAAGRG